ncbi:MAG: LacI family DNA-binding transcriptional regulator [Phototrophicaceae bacterium]
MVKKRVTSKMVAQHAGVSQTTVSFVLNRVEGQNISEETQHRVFDAARELGYVPDAAARNLARGVSDNIAIVFTQPHDAVFSDEYVSYVLTGVVQVMQKKGFRVIVEMVDTLQQSETYLNFAKGKEVAGLIILPYHSRPHDVGIMLDLIKDGFPLISLGPVTDFEGEKDELNTVLIDSASGVHDILNHLLQLGHTRIATISYAPEDGTYESQMRMTIYRNMLREKGIAIDEGLMKYGNYLPESAYQATLELLALDNPPTAIFALNDVMAFGAMSAIQESGYKVPEDIAVVGYDGIHLARYATPSLTTIEAPNLEQGHYAAEMLLKLINGKTLEARQVELQPKLVIRESCGYNLKHSHRR